jgi:hypothetical protein
MGRPKVLSLWIFNRTKESPFGDLVVLAFLIVQALDGALTYVGLSTIGRVVEGNPLVASLMAAFGLGLGLTGAKLFAASLGIALHLFGAHRLIAALTAFYVAGAIVPWMAVFSALG